MDSARLERPIKNCPSMLYHTRHQTHRFDRAGRKHIAVCGPLVPLLFLSFLLGPTVAGAEWMAVDKRFQPADPQTVYYDPDSIHRENDMATVWELTNIQWKGESPTPRFLSAQTQKQFDCPRLRFRVRAVQQFSRHMAKGKTWSGYIENGNWQAVEAQSVNHGLWEAACKLK